MSENQKRKKPCYFWKQYRYSVDVSQISLKGWIDWCNELYYIQHGKKRPKNNKIFINPDLQVATVKGRSWNKDRIEKWLTDHGYSWQMTTEIRYQFTFESPDDVELIDACAELDRLTSINTARNFIVCTIYIAHKMAQAMKAYF